MNHVDHRTTRLLASALVASLLAAAGCGGSAETSEDVTTTTALATDVTISADDWVVEVDKMCAETDEAITPDLTEDEYRQIFNEALDTIDALGLPATGGDEAKLMLEAMRRTHTEGGLNEDQLRELDRQLLEAATVLGVSPECLYIGDV